MECSTRPMTSAIEGTMPDLDGYESLLERSGRVEVNRSAVAWRSASCGRCSPTSGCGAPRRYHMDEKRKRRRAVL